MKIAREIKTRFKELLFRYLHEGLPLEEERELLALPLIHPSIESVDAEGFELLKSKIRKLRFIDLSWKIQDSTASRPERAEYRALLKGHPDLSNFYREICIIEQALMLAVAEEHHKSQSETGQMLSAHDDSFTQPPETPRPPADFGENETFVRSKPAADSFSHESAGVCSRIRDVSYDGFNYDPHNLLPDRNPIQSDWNDSILIELFPQLRDNTY